jgi:hypothetical protein
VPRSSLLLQVLTLGTGLLTEARASDELSVLRESLDEAWWTGPLLAPSPATLPQGHALVEPYLYDAIINGVSAGALLYSAGFAIMSSSTEVIMPCLV